MKKKILAILLSLAFICVFYANCTFAQYTFPTSLGTTYTTCNPYSPYCRFISPGTQGSVDPNIAGYSARSFLSSMSFQSGTGGMSMGMYGMYGMYGSGIGSGIAGLLGSVIGSSTPSGSYGMYGMYGAGIGSGIPGLSGSGAGSIISGGMMGLYGMYGMYGKGTGIGSSLVPNFPSYPYYSGSSSGMMGLYGMYGMYGMGLSTGSGSIFNSTLSPWPPSYPINGNILNTSVPPAL
ncbi:MAG: hypothetical protein ACMUIU_12705 [bacterium]